MTEWLGNSMDTILRVWKLSNWFFGVVSCASYHVCPDRLRPSADLFHRLHINVEYHRQNNNRSDTGQSAVKAVSQGVHDEHAEKTTGQQYISLDRPFAAAVPGPAQYVDVEQSVTTGDIGKGLEPGGSAGTEINVDGVKNKEEGADNAEQHQAVELKFFG